jgi:CubicO group peptidase (beta-lactamase class C family)
MRSDVVRALAPLGALLAALLAGPATAQVATDNPRVTPLDRAVDGQAQAFFRDPCHVGLSLAVVGPEGARFYDYGSTSRVTSSRAASRATARLATPDSLYEIASVTKTFTGALAARAVVDGRMGLDADFRAYLGAGYPNLATAGRPITLRTLAAHTSGLPRDLPDTDALFAKPDFEALPRQLTALQAGWTDQRYRAALADVALRGPPGGEERYSNLGMKVIAFGLEGAYGEPYRDLLAREVLAPLGMTSTGFVPVDPARAVTGHTRGGAPTPPLPPLEDAAWGLWSDARDMARYVAWQLDESDPVVARAHTPVSDGKAMIWNLGTDGGAPILWHGGGSFGMTSQMVLYPKSREGWALMANDACAGTESGLKAMAIGVHAAMGTSHLNADH